MSINKLICKFFLHNNKNWNGIYGNSKRRITYEDFKQKYKY